MIDQTKKNLDKKGKSEYLFPTLEDSFLENKIIVHRWKLLERIFKLTNLCSLVIKREFMNNDDSKKLHKIIKELGRLYNELGKSVPIELPLISEKNSIFDVEIMEFYSRSSEYNMWSIAVKVETILCEINRYKKRDPLLKKLDVRWLLSFFEQEIGDTITDENETPILRISPFRMTPFEDERILNRWEVLNRIFALECFCGKILNCPTISKNDSTILTNLKKELNLLRDDLGKLIPSNRALVTGSKPRYDAKTGKFYHSSSIENLQRVSQEANEIIHMIDDYKKEDPSLENLNIKRLQSVNLRFISDSKD